MVTKVDSTIENLKNLWIELFLDKTNKVSNVADGSVLNATAFGTAKVAQKAIKDIAIVEAKLFPDTAVGEYLDKCAALYGVSPRKTALGSSTYMRVYAQPGTIYDESIVFVNKNGIRFSVDVATTVGSTGYGYVPVRSINAGLVTNVAPNSITTVTPQPTGHIECTNEYFAIGGRDAEDDETFRVRIKNNNNKCSKGTVEYWTQILQEIDPRVLKVMNVGLGENGMYEIYIVSQNGIFFTPDELNTMLEQAKDHFGLFELNLEGDVIGIVFKNVEWFYIGSERGMDFRVELDPEYDILDVRKNIQVALTKYLDFRFWPAGNTVQWDDLLDIVKKAEGVKFVPDEYFFPGYDESVPVNQLPRVRGFIMRDIEGNIIYDSNSALSPLFYPAQEEDIYRSMSDNSLALSQSVYFNVLDEQGNPIEGARISIGVNSVLTNADGQATISLINGNYSYTINKSKYNNATGMFIVLNNSVTINVTLVLAPFTISFVVLDEFGAPLPNVEIAIDNKTIITNINGLASISVKNGTYNYTLTKLGYEQITGRSVVVDNADISVTETMYLFAWNIGIIVQDINGALLPGVIVQIGSNSYLTDSEGKATFKLVNGTYKANLSKVGYITRSENFIVRNQDQTFVFQLDYFAYNFNLTVYGNDKVTPVPGALVEINSGNWTGLTDESGKITFELINGDYIFTINKRGYDFYSSNFNIQNADLDLNANLVLKHYTATITAVDEFSQPIAGASVTINNQVYTTNAAGQVMVSLQNGTYDYTIMKLGYYDYSGSIIVLDSDISDVANMTGRLFNVLFTVKSNSQPVADATIVIFGKSLTTNELGQVSTTFTNGVYNYTISKLGYEEANGQITVSNNDVVEEVDLIMTEYQVLLTVVDRGATIPGAQIEIGGKTVTTSEGGIAIINLVNGTYNYVVSKTGYVDSQGTIVVENKDIEQSIVLIPMSYDVTFSVTENRTDSIVTPIGGVTITINEQILTTDPDGSAHINIYAGKYFVVYEKEGYQKKTVEVDISGVQTVEEKLFKFYTLQFIANIALLEILEGVTISLSGPAIVNGPITVTTNAEGKTDEVVVINGNYNWSASKEGYSPEIGTGSIADENQVKTIELTYGTETTFHVTGNSPSSEPIEGGTIEVDTTDTLTTGADGNAKINLSIGNHIYRVSKTGYIPVNGNIDITSEPQTIEVELLSGGRITFTAMNGDSPIEGATITVNSITRAVVATGTTDASGQWSHNLENGTYNYTIAKTGYKTSDPIEFTVNSADDTLSFDMENNFYWELSFANVLGGSLVVVKKDNAEGETVFQQTPTDTGTVTWNQALSGTYYYEITKAEYKDISGTTTIDQSNVTIDINQEKYSTVTFTCSIKDSSPLTPIEGVSIVFNGETKSTNASGVAAFTNVLNGTYPYTATPPSPMTAKTGEVVVTGSDVNVAVEFDNLTDLTFNVTGETKTPVGVYIQTVDGKLYTRGEYESMQNKPKGTGVYIQTKDRNLYTQAEYKALFRPNGVYIQTVDGTLYTKEEWATYKPADGVYIESVDGDLYTRDQWSALATKPQANGITVVDGAHIFTIATIEPSPSTWGSGVLVNNIVVSSERNTALADFSGKSNTNYIVSQLGVENAPVAEYCQNYIFPNDQKGYLPSLGEWKTAYNYKDEITTCMSLIGGADISVRGSTHWSSTQSATTSAWVFQWANSSSDPSNKGSSYAVRAFTPTKKYTPNGIAVISDDTQFVISIIEYTETSKLTGNTISTSGVFTTTDSGLAATDYVGKLNTEYFLFSESGAPALLRCTQYEFPNGQKGFLGSGGQWKTAHSYKTEVVACLDLIGGTALNTGSNPYWSSTQYSSTNAWVLSWTSGDLLNYPKTNAYRVRAFAPLLLSDENKKPTGIGIVEGTHSYKVALTSTPTSLAWDSSSSPALIPEIATTSITADARSDWNGLFNTTTILNTIPDNGLAAEYCANEFEFEDGSPSYLPSFGEFAHLRNNKDLFNALLNLVGGNAILQGSFWTSTQYSAPNAWRYNFTGGSWSGYGKVNNAYVRPFGPLINGDPSLQPNSVAVVDDNCSFIISLEDFETTVKWQTTANTIEGITTTTDTNAAKLDFNGKVNSDTIVTAKYGGENAPANNYCQNYTFPDGSKGYLPAAGEWNAAFNNKSEVDLCLTLIGGRAIDSGTYYWSSTQYSSGYAWSLNWSDGNVGHGNKSNSLRVRAFGVLDTSVTGPLENATIDLYESSAVVDTKQTDAEGKAIFPVPLNSNRNYIVSKDTYITASGSLSNIQPDTTENVELEPGVQVIFKVTENTSSGSPVQAVSINIKSTALNYDVTFTTDSNGVLIAYVKKGAAYDITLTKDGYTTVTLPDQVYNSNSNNQNVIMLRSYTITVNCKRVGVNWPNMVCRLQTSSWLLEADTDNDGNAVFVNLSYEENVTILWGDENTAEYSAGSMKINVDADKTVNVSLTPLYSVIVETGQGGATVNLGSSTLTTGTDGNATFSRIPVGTVAYTVSKTGFETISGNYAVEQSTALSYSLSAILQIQPKLVLVTSGTGQTIDLQSQAEGRKYVSILAVSKGAVGKKGTGISGGGGGNSGIFYYLSNQEVSHLTSLTLVFFAQFDDTRFTLTFTDGSYKISLADQNQSMGASGNSTNAVIDRAAVVANSDANSPGWFTGGNGAASGGTYGHTGGDGGGTSAPYIGGDGICANPSTAGAGGTGAAGWVADTDPIIIPITSVFSGTGQGGKGAGSFGGAGGAGGYGNGGTAGGGNGGYGAGGAGGNDESVGGLGGGGIICLYYHNDPITPSRDILK